MGIVSTLVKRELKSYFQTPIAYVFIVVFLVLSGIFTFYFGHFFNRQQADLVPFFNFHPWLYAIFVPAISMRLWAEERKTGTLELLFTLPITNTQAVLSKFLAAWAFTSISLFLTFPMIIIVNYLGSPDNGMIAAGYLGSLLLAGGYLAIGCCISATTKNQVIAFILSLSICFLLNLMGFPLVMDALRSFLPAMITDTLSSFSFLTNFDAISHGLLELRSIIYFASTIIFFLFANSVVIEIKKA